MVRDCTVEDVPWLCEIGKRTYAGLVKGYDDACAERWARACVASPNIIVVRGDGMAAFAVHGADPWAPSVQHYELVHLFGRATTPMEAVKVVGAVNDRRKAAGADRLFIGSLFSDLAPIAQRLGARMLNPYYVIEG